MIFETPEDIQKIMRVYTKCGSRKEWISTGLGDRFGIISDTPDWLYQKPQKDDTPLSEACEQRAIEIVNKYDDINLAWSGGIDSTFLFAVLCKLGIPFTAWQLDTTPAMFRPLYNILKRKHSINRITLREFKDIPNLLTGDGADTQLCPAFNNLYHAPENNLINPYGTDFKEKLNNDILWNKIVTLSDYLNKPIDTNDHIIKLLNWSTEYFKRRDSWRKLCGNQNIIYFFDTQQFADIAWSQHWDDRYDYGHETRKYVFRAYASDYFKDDKLLDLNILYRTGGLGSAAKKWLK